jgi:hypothetical protein
MITPNLIGKAVRIGAGDVFDECHLPNPFAEDFFAVVISISHDPTAIALLLREPITIGEKMFSHAVAAPRHEGDSVSELLDGKRMISALTLVSDQQFPAKSPCDLSWWRGGNAVIATINLA